MIQNPMISSGGDFDYITGSFRITANSPTISIPVSRKCSKVILINTYLSTDYTKISDANYGDEGPKYLVVSNIDFQSMVSGNSINCVYIMNADGSTSIRTGTTGHNSFGTQLEEFTFNENSIEISGAEYFSKGNYMFIAW